MKPSRAQLIINIVVIVLLVIILGAILVPRAKAQEQNFDFSVSVYVYNGPLAGIPATCNAGDLAFITNATNGQNIYECNPNNTFTQQLNSGGSGAFSNGLGAGYQDVTEIAAPANPAAGNDRLYTDSTSHLLACLTTAGASCMPPAAAHNLLSATHADTTASTAVRGGGIFAIGASPTWTQVAHSATSGGYFKWNGTDIVASTGAASGTGTPTACSSQVVTGFTLSADAAPTSTCATITTAFLPGTGSTTVNTNTCTLGSSCTIGLGQIGNPAATTSFSYALNQGATVAMTGTATNSWTTDSATAQFFNAKNTTAAVVGTSQGSPKLALCGRAFHGSADVEDCMTFGSLPGNGNDAAITFNYGHTGTSTGAVTHVFTGTLQSSALTASLPTCTDASKNITSTCTGLVTVADLASGATTVNGQTCTLGSSCTIPLSAVNPETATYQVLAADFSNYKTITVASGTFTITLVASGSQPAAGQYIQIINYGSGVVTVARSGQNINGAAGNFTLSAGSATAPTSAYVISDATNYFASIDEGTVGTVTSAVVAGTANQVTVTGTCTITTTGTCTLSLPSAVILGTDGSVAGTLQLANGGASAHTIYASGATTTNTIAGFAAVPTTGDLVDCTSASTTCTLHDSGVATANVVTASANGTTKQLCTVAASNKACTWIDFPDVKYIPAANCNNTTAGSGWGIGSGGTVTCRAGTNNLGGYVSITDTSTTFATFQIEIPEDWDTASNPYIRFQLASTDATNSHTIIPEINVACYKGDGSTTDDVAANGFHSLSTTTLNGSANRFWSGSNVQMNSTDVTGCVAGALMQVTVGRATDTATNAQFYGATVTFPRLLTVQAN